jgi:hypothetical protein
MKAPSAEARRLALPAMSMAASIARTPAAPSDEAQRPSRTLMRLGLIFAVLGLLAAPLVAVAIR